MENFDKIEDTLFVPMLGRIYSTEKFPCILNDKKALELKEKLPDNIKGKDTQTEYTLMAGAVRSSNMDRYVKNFILNNSNGVIVELGCGLETSYYRNNNDKNYWYEVDLPEVIKYRKEILGETENNICIAASAFSEDWIKEIRKRFPIEPILIVVSGVFYYFKKEEVKSIIDMLKKYGNIELVFDIVNSSGMKRISKYMKQVGHEEANMYFYVDDANDMVKELGIELLSEEPYYKYCLKKGLKFSTKLTMNLSDMLMMVKMIHIKIN